MENNKGNSSIEKNTEIEKGNSFIEKNTEIEKGNSIVEKDEEFVKENSIFEKNNGINKDISLVEKEIENKIEKRNSLDEIDEKIKQSNSTINENIEIDIADSLNENYVEICEPEMESEQAKQIENKRLKKRSTSYFEQKLNKLYNPVDIKYRGPLSSRYLSLLAWLAIAIGQWSIVNSITNLFNFSIMGSFFEVLVMIIYILSTPLFIIASFGRTLSGNSSYLDFFISKGLSYFGIGIAVSIFYLRYLQGLFHRIDSDDILPEIMNSFIVERVNINIFADIFVLGLFHFFVNYNPKVYFQGKKIIIFRLMSIIPVLYIIISNLLIILSGTTDFKLPFYAYPFITVRSPTVCLIFICSSLWIKNRKRIFLKLGSTEKEYKKFILTNRNSLSFSIFLSVIIVVFCIIEFIILIVFVNYQKSVKNADDLQIDASMKLYGIGQCFSLILAIPFIMLYSYTKTHENKMYDVAIPFIGIGIAIFVYIEGVYQMLIYFVDQGKIEDNGSFDINEVPSAGL